MSETRPRSTPKSVEMFDPGSPAPIGSVTGATTVGTTDPEFRAPEYSRVLTRIRAEHMGLVMTVAYLLVASLGMLHEALVFLRFRINILDYAEPSDFLVAAMRDPLILVVGLAAIPLVSLYYRFVVRANAVRTGPKRWWQGSDRSRAFLRRHYTPFFVGTILLYALAFSLAYARRVAEQLRQGNGPHVQVELMSDPGGMMRDTTPLVLIGTTQKYLFLYDPARQLTSILPSSNVARVIVDRRRSATAK